MMVGGMCSMLPYNICHYAYYFIVSVQFIFIINPASAEFSLCMLSSPGWVFPHTAPKKIGYGGKNAF